MEWLPPTSVKSTSLSALPEMMHARIDYPWDWPLVRELDAAALSDGGEIFGNRAVTYMGGTNDAGYTAARRGRVAADGTADNRQIPSCLVNSAARARDRIAADRAIEDDQGTCILIVDSAAE
jgi:hypothetical protein